MTQSDQMAVRLPRGLAAAVLLAFYAAASPWQQGSVSRSDTDYKVDRPHPRLLMPQRRVRLLQRERERKSMRWDQFNLLIQGRVQMPEPGFAYALYYVASGDESVGQKAVDWAAGPGADPRQIALVFDWCQPLLGESTSARLRAKLEKALGGVGRKASIPEVRNRLFASVALAGHSDGSPEAAIRGIVEEWWNKDMAPALREGASVIHQPDHMALFEIFHALRDTFDIDPRESAPKYFVTLPAYHILAHYPAPFPAAENEYRIPLMKEHADPDLREAARSRAAAFSMVAYDNNAEQMQFLQGWLMLDRFLMRSPYGTPYEFMWANPYQPGLSYHYLPQVFHDPLNGRLLLRSSLEDDALWFCQSEGGVQVFRDGQVVNLEREAMNRPLVLGGTIVLPAALAEKFLANEEEPVRFFIVGLKPNARYDIEVDDEELREVETDRGGVLELNFPARRNAYARLRERKVP